MDIAPAALELARQVADRDLDAAARRRVRFERYEGRAIPFPDGEFDVVLVNDAFHHFPNPRTLLAEFHRTLGPHGRFAFCEPGIGHAATAHSERERAHGVLEEEVDLDQLERSGRAAGFEEMELLVPALDPEAFTLSDIPMEENAYFVIRGVSVEPDGGLIVLDEVVFSFNDRRAELRRIDGNGAIDTSYGDNGRRPLPDFFTTGFDETIFAGDRLVLLRERRREWAHLASTSREILVFGEGTPRVGRAQVVGGVLSFVAGTGARSHVIVSRGTGRFRVRDLGVPRIEAGPGCVSVEDQEVRCRRDATRVEVTTGRYDDRVAVTTDAAPAVVHGGADDDDLRSRDGDEDLHGGTGHDYVDGGLGADFLDGGTGVDTTIYRFATHGVVVTLGGGAADGEDTDGDGDADEGDDTRVERLFTTPFGDSVVGSGAHEEFNAGDGVDDLNGGGGNDDIGAGAGDDTIDAVDGVPDHVDCNAGNDTVRHDPFTGNWWEDDDLWDCETATPGAG